MKLIYKGKFNGDPESLPCGEHRPGAVKFREAENPKQLAIWANAAAIVLLAALGVLLYVRCGKAIFSYAAMFASLSSLLALFPHEILHAICFRNEVYLYTNWKQGMLFVVGPEDMSRARFVGMSLLPNLIFGFLPFLLCMCFPQLTFLGMFGALCISMGVGDYYNVFNALTQMPKGARTYLYHFNSYWYMPQ